MVRRSVRITCRCRREETVLAARSAVSNCVRLSYVRQGDLVPDMHVLCTYAIPYYASGIHWGDLCLFNIYMERSCIGIYSCPGDGLRVVFVSGRAVYEEYSVGYKLPGMRSGERSGCMGKHRE